MGLQIGTDVCSSVNMLVLALNSLNLDAQDYRRNARNSYQP